MRIPRIPKVTFSCKVVVAILFFGAIAMADTFISFTEPDPTDTPHILFASDSMDGKGSTDTDEVTVGATIYNYVDEKKTKVFEGTDGTAVPMAKTWSGSWKYKNDAKKTWPKDVYSLQVYNKDKGSTSNSSHLYQVIDDP